MHPHTQRFGVGVSGVRHLAPCGPAADVIGYDRKGKPILGIAGGSPASGILEVVEVMDAAQASMDRLFESDLGYRAGSSRDPKWTEKLAKFTDLLLEAKAGNFRAQAVLRETQTTSDFGLLFGDVLQRQLLGRYREVPATYRNFVRVSEVPDFREVVRYAVDGAEGALPLVGEADQYPEAALSESDFRYRVHKRGRRLTFSWEAWINDDLGAFGDSPDRLARAARRSEERFATELYVDTNGPHASLYTAGNANIINQANGASADNPPLSIAALQDALTVLANQRDADGEPIAIGAVHLVVPPALEVVANNIVNALQIEAREAGGTTNQTIIARNWMAGRMRVHVAHYIPVVAATANGDRSWFLFADPAESRPALEVGFLRGNTEPAIFRKLANAERVGGGLVSPAEGDFDTDSLAFKVRHVFGGTRLDGKATVASNGSGA